MQAQKPVKQASYHNNKRPNSTAACGTGAPRDQHLVSGSEPGKQKHQNLSCRAATQHLMITVGDTKNDNHDFLFNRICQGAATHFIRPIHTPLHR